MWDPEQFSAVRDKLSGWWEGESARPVVQVFSPDPRPRDLLVAFLRSAPTFRRSTIAKELGWDVSDWQWGFAREPDRPERTIGLFLKWVRNTFFGGAAYPNLWVNLGAGVLAAYLGMSVKVGRNTVWFGAYWNPAEALELREVLGLEFRKDNIWWRRTVNITRAALSLSRGNYIVGITDLGGIADILASIIGTEGVIRSMYEAPSVLEEAMWKILEDWHRCYDELHGMIASSQEGISAWMNIWCLERWYPIQCDLAYMLSPRLFRRFVRPFLEEQAERLDRVIYHLDGPGELVHVDEILDIDGIDGIQWVPGAGMEGLGHHCGSDRWYPLYRKILRAGKRLVLYMPCDAVPKILNDFKDGRVLVQTYCPSRRSALELLEMDG